MSGGVIYSAGGEIIVDTTREALVEEHLANLTTAVMLLIESHCGAAEASLRQGLTPGQRHDLTDHLTDTRDLQEQLLRGALALFGGRAQEGRSSA